MLISTLIGGVRGAFGEGPVKPITLVEAMNWEWDQFLGRVISDLITLAICGLVLALIFGVLTLIWKGPIIDVLFGIGVVLILVLFIALSARVIGGLFTGLKRSTGAKSGKTLPNQGVKLSSKNSLAAFLITFLTVGLTVWLISGLIGSVMGWPLILGFILGLNRGGSAVIKHYALRLSLWLKGVRH